MSYATLTTVTWCVVAVLALVATLNSLERDDFDRPNVIGQIPFVLPWFIIPIGKSKHVFNAWLAAAMGWVNAALLYLWLMHSPRRASRAASIWMKPPKPMSRLAPNCRSPASNPMQHRPADGRRQTADVPRRAPAVDNGSLCSGVGPQCP